MTRLRLAQQYLSDRGIKPRVTVGRTHETRSVFAARTLPPRFSPQSMTKRIRAALRALRGA